jgi:hypothetical protein
LVVQEEIASPRNGWTASLDGSPEALPQAPEERSEIALDDLVFCVVAAFRRHPHINNVLTHISEASWSRVEQALRVILDPRAGSGDLSPLARNIVDLMCADRGVTGQILKPYYRDLLTNVLGPRMATHLIAHVTCLSLEYEVATRPAATVDLTNAFASPSGGEFH